MSQLNGLKQAVAELQNFNLNTSYVTVKHKNPSFTPVFVFI